MALGLGIFVYRYPPDPNSHTDPDRRAPYIEMVDGLCAEAIQAGEALGPVPEDRQAAGHFMLEIARTLGVLLQKWTGNPFPEEDEDLLRPIVDSLERIVRANNEYGPMLARGQEPASTVFETIRADQAEFRQRSRAYGFQTCAAIF
ncbi:hypothetical protein ACFP2T_47695 [Plantactinospora solaniradicis]|uniref:Uncharacterized protein n=1 Tax=Plantactinospora solaniradicis TaxID=1723736 RepID=A0ABW1KTH3_9ACTN